MNKTFTVSLLAKGQLVRVQHFVDMTKSEALAYARFRSKDGSTCEVWNSKGWLVESFIDGKDSKERWAEKKHRLTRPQIELLRAMAEERYWRSVWTGYKPVKKLMDLKYIELNPGASWQMRITDAGRKALAEHDAEMEAKLDVNKQGELL